MRLPGDWHSPAACYRAEGGHVARCRRACDDSLTRDAAWDANIRRPLPNSTAWLYSERKTLRAALLADADPSARVALRSYMIARRAELADVDDDRILIAAHERLAELQDELAARAVQARNIEEASRSISPLDVALKYARYEGSLLRRLDLALARLEHLQSHRVRGAAGGADAEDVHD